MFGKLIFFGSPGKRSEKTRTYKDPAQHSKSTSMYGTRFRNSEKPSKVTRVCKEFVTKEPTEDITVCKTVFGEPNGLPKEVIVYKTALPDSKDTPKKTICKDPNSNFTNQDDVNRVSLNDAKDKLVEESTNNSNLNSPEENIGSKRIVKLNNMRDNIVLNNFTRQQSINVEQDEQIKKILNDQSKNSHQIPVESIKDSKLLSKNIYFATSPRAQLYGGLNLISNFNVKKTSKTLVNPRRMQSLNRSMRNHFQPLNNLTQNLAPNKNNQLEGKAQESMKEELKKEKERDVSKEMKTENKRKESLFYRSLKKLIGTIRRDRTLVTDRIETGKIEVKKTIDDDKKDVEKSEIVSEEIETEDKTGDIKDQQKKTEKVAIPMGLLQTEIANGGKI